MRVNPRDWRIEDLESVARAFAINVRKPSGSHVVFEHPLVIEGVSVPARRLIKPVYVKAFVRFVESVLDAGGDCDG